MITMEVFMDIISLHRQGMSLRTIAKKLGVHRNTVKKYVEGGPVPLYRKGTKRNSILDPYRQLIDDYLAEDDYQATWIHERLQKLGFTGSYKTIQNYVHSVKERRMRLAYARFESEPGLQAQVDWADFQIANPDGTSTTLYLFLMILGFSRAMHIEFVNCCTLETFMDCHKHAFSYLHGVPGEILYDNMKHVVISRSAGKPIFNSEFLHFAHHYSFHPKSCPPYSPWVKGKVERPMEYIRQRFWRGYTYTTLEKLNRDVGNWLNTSANRRRHRTHGEPINERWEKEIILLSPLPRSEYDTSIKVIRKVYKDCQISYNGNRYIVPYQTVGRKVMLKIKHGWISIYDDRNLLVTYQEASGKNELVGNRLFYEQLKRDQDLARRKYGKNKGKATRGLTTDSLFPQVAHRSLAEYDTYVHGGGQWNS